MTVAGVVFSITMVALTLASQQYGSRLLANFTRDRGNQFTLGVFLATFLYALLILRSIHGTGHADVPHLSVTVALVMAIAGVSVLIYFVHHMAVTIQSPNLAALVAGEFRHVLDRTYPAGEDGTAVPEPDDAEAAEVLAGKRGYLQLVDYAGLAALAEEHDLLIRVERRPGKFVVPSEVIARAWPADRVDEAVAERIRRHVNTGARRTHQQDAEFPARQLTEIAVRALSPAINDVVTATICVDQLSDGLCDAATRPLAGLVGRGSDGRTRAWGADPVTFTDLVAAYDGIRECASFHAPVYVHALDALMRVARCVRDAERLEPVRKQARLFLEAAERDVEAEADREPIRRRYDALTELIGS
jgi:uncharacterized membrane protein